MTRAVAVARGVLGSLVLWLIGSVVIYVAFRLGDAHTTIKDVPGHASRVQLVWWGAHAFSACVGALVGCLLTAGALTRAFLAEPPQAAALGVAGPGAAGLVLLAGLGSTAVIGHALLVADLLGLATGLVAATAFVIAHGAADGPPPSFGALGHTTGRSWGSR